MNFFKKYKFNIIFGGILALVTFILWWPTRMLPYWWDSAGYIMHAARFYIDTNFSSFILPSDAIISDFAHPPLFPFLLAITWKIFGQSIFVSHVFYLFFVLLSVLGAYLLGKEVAKKYKDKLMPHLVGFSSALLLLFSPLFLAQVGIIYVEIPATAFALLAVYFFLRSSNSNYSTKLSSDSSWIKLNKVYLVGYLVSASLMLFMKEVSAIVLIPIIVIVAFKYLKEFFSKKKDRLKVFANGVREIVIHSTPLLLLVGWFIWHKIATGWMFYLSSRNFKASFSWAQLQFVFNFFFLSQSRWLISVLGIIFVFIIFSRYGLKKFINKEIILITSIAILTSLLFALTEFLSRYIILGLAFFFILFSYILAFVLHPPLKRKKIETGKKVIFLAISISIAFFFTLEWNNNTKITQFHFSPLEENIEYIDVIRVGKQMAQFIEVNYPNAVVYTGFPATYMLSEPFQGYVSKSIEAIDCKKYEEGDDVDLIVYHLMSPSQVKCLNIIKQLDFNCEIEEGGFAYNGKWMQICLPKVDVEAK